MGRSTKLQSNRGLASRSIYVHAILALAAALLWVTPGSGAQNSALMALGNYQAAAAHHRQRELRVLFVGNSLTAANDLPSMVQALAATVGVKMHAVTVATGGFSLEDHWQNGPARQLLASHRWDYVVLQQGPSSLPASQVHLKHWAKQWAAEARRLKVRPALYMVWPFQGQTNGFELVSHSYRAAALASKSLILPAGEAWHALLRNDPSIPLYSEDGLHPTPLGTFVAALVITKGLTGVNPHLGPSQLRSLPEGAVPNALVQQVRRTLRR